MQLRLGFAANGMIFPCHRCGHWRNKSRHACPAVREARQMLAIPEVRRAAQWETGMREVNAPKPQLEGKWRTLFCLNRIAV